MEKMEFLLQRYSDNGNSSQGSFHEFFPRQEFIAHSLEDEKRDVKVMGETRIDAGVYPLGIAKFVEKRIQTNHGFKSGDCLQEPIQGKPLVKSTVPTRWIVEAVLDANSFTLDVVTKLTWKHREAYNNAGLGVWFDYHIQILNLPRHQGVYFHAGNEETHTDACVLLGDTQNNHRIEKDKMTRSTQAVKRFYDRCMPWLKAGKPASVIVRDEIYLYK